MSSQKKISMKDTRKCNCVWHASGCGCTAEDASARPLDKRFLREGRSPNKALYTDRQQSCMHGCNISCTSQMQPRSLQQTPRNTYTNIFTYIPCIDARRDPVVYRENGWCKIMQITLNATCSGWLSDRKIQLKRAYYESYGIQYHVAVCATPLTHRQWACSGFMRHAGPSSSSHPRLTHSKAPVTDACTAH